MSDEHFFKHPHLPFAECRYSVNSGRHYKLHMHKSFSVGAIDRGEVVYQVEGEKACLRPGSLALMNPELMHSCNPTKSGERSYYMLHLDVDWCLALQQSMWNVDQFRPVNIILLRNESIYRHYISTMQLLMNEGDLLEKEQALIELAENIFLNACEPAAIITEPSLQIEHAKLLMSQNLEDDLSLQHLATKLNANPYTLLRQFKKATGVTPHAYLLNIRIERARELLQQGLNVAQVALECGFFDQSHFHRHFKAITAVTPREYQVNFQS